MWPVIICLTILSIEKRLSSEILAWKGLSCSLYLLPKIDMELINLLSLILSSSKWKCDCNIDKKKIKCPWSIVYRLVFLLQTRLADRGILIYCVIIQCKSRWWFSLLMYMLLRKQCETEDTCTCTGKLPKFFK